MPVYTSSIEVTADYPTIKPSLNLNFARSRALDPRITFTRASAATYIGRDGLVKYAGEDEPRFDHDPDTLESLGLLIEESRTNLITNSALPLSAAGGNLTSSNLTVSVASSTVSPDGTTDGVFRYTSGPGSAAYRLGTAGGGVAQATYTGSIWVRAVSGTASFNIDINDQQAVGYTVDETWRRVAVSGARSDSSAYMFMDVNASPNNDLYFWGPQLEQATFETSYIKTTGSSVTRAYDLARVIDYSDWHTVAGTWVAEYYRGRSYGDGSSGRVGIVTGYSNEYSYAPIVDEPTSRGFSNRSYNREIFPSNSSASISGFGYNSLIKQIGTLYDDGIGCFVRSSTGQQVSTSTTGVSGAVTVYAPNNGIRIGGANNGNYGSLNKPIRMVSFYPYVMTTNQINSILQTIS